MTATVRISAGPALGPEALAEALAARRVTAGVDPELQQLLGDALRDPSFTSGSQRIAAGRPAADGEDERFEPCFDSGLLPGRLRDDGTLDFFDRELVKVVDAGEVVGMILAPTEGLAGFQVDGSPLPPTPGRAGTLEIGPLLERDEVGTVTASAGGAFVHVEGRRIAITQHLEHKGDVDLRSGHLTMRGSLVVFGSVLPGLRLETSEDLDLKGFSDGGEIYVGGNLRVSGLLRGGARGEVTAEGDVIAASAESVAVTARGTVTVHHALNATLRGANVVVERRIRGGHAQAAHRVSVLEAGSPAGVQTVLEAGVVGLTTAELRERLALAKGERLGAHRAALRSWQDAAPDGRRHREQVEHEARTSHQRIERARQRQRLLQSASVEIRGTLHVGTAVRLGGLQYEVTMNARSLRISYDRGARALRIEDLQR